MAAPAPPPTDPASPSGSATPDPGIPAAEILNGTLTVPAWPNFDDPKSCAKGAVKFTNGRADSRTYSLLIVDQPIHVDVDGDGTPESVVRIGSRSQTLWTQVLVYDRDPGGPIRLMGSVLATPTGSARQFVDVWIVHAVEGTADGKIRLDVGDTYPCCDVAADLPQHQWRTYGWNGQKFVQTGGPTSFGPNPKVADTSVSAGDVVMRQGTDGKWRGTVTVKVRNDGPGAARNVLGLSLPDGVADAGTGPNRCTSEYATTLNCDLGVIARGTERTVRVDLVSTGAPSGQLDLWVQPSRGRVSGTYPDVNYDDNNASVRLSAG